MPQAILVPIVFLILAGLIVWLAPKAVRLVIRYGARMTRATRTVWIEESKR